MRASKLLLTFGLTAGVLAQSSNRAFPRSEVASSSGPKVSVSSVSPPSGSDAAVLSRRDICNVQDLDCLNGKRDSTSNAVPLRDWPRWGCAHGMESLCNHSDNLEIDKRDDSEDWLDEVKPKCTQARADCDDGNNCACLCINGCNDAEDDGIFDHHGLKDCLFSYGFWSGDQCTAANTATGQSTSSEATSTGAASAEITSVGATSTGTPSSRATSTEATSSEVRSIVGTPLPTTPTISLPNPPTEVFPTAEGQSATDIVTSGDSTVTAIFYLQQTSPLVMVNTFIEDDATAFAIISAMSDASNIVAETVIMDGYTQVGTITYNGNPFTVGTSTTSLAKRGAAPTSTFAQPTPKRFEAERKKRQRVQTLTIVDEQPGYETLNADIAGQSEYTLTQVTVVESERTLLTLTPTTDAQGNTILVTEDPHVSHKTTNTVELLMDVDGVETSMPSETAEGRTKTTTTTHTSTHDEYVTFDPLLAIPSLYSTQPVESEIEDLHHTIMAIQSQPPTVTKIITQTVTRHGLYGHYQYPPAFAPHYGWMMATKTMVDLGSTTVPVTQQMQLLNNSTMLIVPPRAQATLVPLEWDPSYLRGWEHVLDMSLETSRTMYPEANWDEIPNMAFHLRERLNIDPDLSLKYALIMTLRTNRLRYRHYEGLGAYPTLSHDHYNATKMFAHISGTDIPITASTQTVNGHVYAVDPLMKYKMYDPVRHAVAPTGACRKDNEHHGSKTMCQYERCMWEHMKPINVTTAMPMAMYDHYGDHVVYDYFTHTTHLHRVHWGTTEARGIYYPTKHTLLNGDGIAVHTVLRQTPAPFYQDNHQRKQYVHGDPKCWSPETCYDLCTAYHDPLKDPMDTWLKIALPIAGAILLAILALLCCCCLHRRRKRNPNRRRSSLIPEKLRRKSSHPPEVVVNQVTGAVTDPAGNPVEPAAAATTAVLAGSAAGAAAVNEKAKDNGQGNQTGTTSDDRRGTTGRRAEEGRGRVNFADGEKPGTDKPAAAEAEKPAAAGEPTEKATAGPSEKPAAEPAPAPEPKPAESTEPVPVSDKDGAGGVGTGRQGPDVGSMRGRKRNRPDGGMGLNLNP